MISSLHNYSCWLDYFKWASIGFLLALAASTAYAGKSYFENPDSYRARLRTLQPGDQLHLLPGEYKQGLPVHNLQGREGSPIIISGPRNGPRAVLLGRLGHNTVSILNSSHVQIRDLEINGQRLPVDAIKCEGHAKWAHHITLERLLIHQHDHNHQIVAISTKCTAWHWVIRSNTISGAGTGLYLGDSDGSAPFIAGLIEYNLISNTLGYNLQIKHQRARPNWPGMPIEPSETIIRHNVFSKAIKDTMPGFARPNVLVGHWPLSGAGRDDRYLIYGNFFHQNPHEALFQGEGNIALYNNLFVNHWGNGIRIQPHKDAPRAISIFFNTILAAGGGIHLANKKDDAHFTQMIANNAIFAERPLTGVAKGKDNFIRAYQAAENYLLQPSLPVGKMNLKPQREKMSPIKIDSISVRNLQDWDRDFDGHQNDSRFGAYAYEQPLNWHPRLQIKPIATYYVTGDHPSGYAGKFEGH